MKHIRTSAGRRGQSLFLLAFGAIVFFGFLAFAVDWGRLVHTRQKLRNHCDASALAGAQSLPDSPTAKLKAAEYYARNVNLTISDVTLVSTTANTSLYRIGIDDVWVTTPYTNSRLSAAGIPPANAIEVRACRMLYHHIGALLGAPRAYVCARAVAIGATAPKAGIVVLHPTQRASFDVGGNAALTVIGGEIYVNSNHSCAASLGSNASVTDDANYITGSYCGGGTWTPLPITGVPPLPDPFATLPVPDITGMPVFPSVRISGGSITLSPGIYLDGIRASGGTITLQPGIYVMAGGGFAVTGAGSVIGHEIMLYNTGHGGTPTISGATAFGDITLSGMGMINLSQPTTGTYKDMLIFQDRANPQQISFTGNGAMTGITGNVYAKAANLKLSGNGSGINSNMVVDTLTISGGANLVSKPHVPLVTGRSDLGLFE